MAGSIIIATHLYHETKTITDDVALNCLMNIGLTTYTVEQIESTRLEIMNYDGEYLCKGYYCLVYNQISF